ncbi:MAG: hypothetical protein PHF65_05770 [Oscillospiraceae bacterium]|nr:hypothetical protein [Oscillospiraceae bacterium]
MKKPLILMTMAICSIVAVTACSTSRRKEAGDTTDVNESTTVLYSETTRSTVPESDPTKAPTPTLTPTPTEATNPFTFDLTEDEVTDEKNTLLFFPCMKEVVIVPKDSPVYRMTARFENEKKEDDWSEIGIDSPHCQYSIDRTKIAFIHGDWFDTKKLAYYDGEKTREVVSCDYFSFSLTGNVIVYDAYVEDAEALCLYDCEKDESRILYDYDVYSRCISPTGDAVAFRDAEDAICVIKEEADPILICQDGFPVEISDGGELVYYTKKVLDKWNFYVYTEGEHIRLAGAGDEGGSTSGYCNLLFNRDLTQVLIAINQQLLFSKDGSEAVCISEITDHVTASDSVRRYDKYDIQCRSTDTLIQIENRSYLPAKNLCNQLYRFKDTLIYLDSNFNVRYISTQTAEHGDESSRYGDQLVFLEKSSEYDGFDLCYTENFREDGPAEKISVEYVTDVVITKSGSIYVENDIEQLYVVNDRGAPRLLDTYVNLIGRYETEGSTFIYYTKRTNQSSDYSFDLYCIEDAENAGPQKIASKIIDVFIDYTGIYTHRYSSLNIEYGQDYVYYRDIDYSKDGRNFSFLSAKEYGT